MFLEIFYYFSEKKFILFLHLAKSFRFFPNNYRIECSRKRRMAFLTYKVFSFTYYLLKGGKIKS